MLVHTFNLNTWARQVDLSESKFRLSFRKARADTHTHKTTTTKQKATIEDNLKAKLRCSECSSFSALVSLLASLLIKQPVLNLYPSFLYKFPFQY